MTRELRRRQRFLVVALAIVLPIALLAIALTRRHPITAGRLPSAIEADAETIPGGDGPR